MSDAAKDLIDQSKPWRADVRWQVVAIEAVLLVAIGLFMLISPDRAGDWILQIIGLVLLVASLQLAVVSLRSGEGRHGSFEAFRAGIGVSVGVIATSIWWSDYISNNAARIILGWGLVAFALIQIVALVTKQGRSGLRLSTLVLSALTLVLGIMLLTSNSYETVESRLTFLGVVLLVFGLLLGGLAYLLMSGSSDTKDSSSGSTMLGR